MTDVAVVFPPLRVSRDFIDYPYFADLGAVQAAAVLREAGMRAALVDALAIEGAGLAPLDGGEVRLGATVERTLDAMPGDARATVVAFTPFHRPPSRDPLLGELLSALRRDRPDAPIVLADLYQSGQHVVDAKPEDTLAAYPEVDVFLRYEAEDRLAPLLADLASTGRPSAPRAIDGGEPAPLDALPLPAWDLVDMDRYFAFHEEVAGRLGRPRWAFPIDGRSAPALTSRGCPYRCIHCSSNPTSRRDGALVAPKTQRRYAPAYLDRLFADLRARGVRRVHLLDELINVSERHFDAVLALLAKHDLAFEVPNGMRADYVLPEHLATMRGRMTTLSISAESGVQRVIDEVVDKKLDLSAIRVAARGAAAAGIPMLVHFMIGLPGETRPEINGTLAFAIDLHEETGASPSVQFATPLPGTRLAAAARERGRVLPLIRDYGPHFQKLPSMETEHASFADLERFRASFDRRIEAASGPSKVVLGVSTKCNNRCVFCATAGGSEGDLARQRALLATHRERGATELEIDGGEPTLSPGLFGLVAHARRLGYARVGLTTNARMASYEGFADRLVRSGLTSIVTSIHGADAATHGAIVGVAEAFDQTCAGARNLVKLAPPSVSLGATVTLVRSNQGKLDDIARLVLDLGLRRLDVRLLAPFGRGTRTIAPDMEEATREVAALLDRHRRDLAIRVIDLPVCLLPGHEDRVAPDELALPKRVVYASTEGVDVLAYHRAHKIKKPVCEGCVHASSCSGFYAESDASDPPWIDRPSALVHLLASAASAE